MIISFNCKKTANLFGHNYVSSWSKSLQYIALRKLYMLDAANNINDLRIPPANRLKRIYTQDSLYSIRVNDQWRILFKWKSNNAYNVEVIDYH